MRTLLKILALPFVLALTVLAPFVLFVFVTARVLLGLVSGLMVLAAIVLFITGDVVSGSMLMIGAFLLSPFGIPAIAEWMVRKLYMLKHFLRDFLAS